MSIFSRISSHRNSGDHNGHRFSTMLEAGQSAASDVKEKLGDAKDFTVDHASSIYSAVRRAIKARPLLAVGVAFGVGAAAISLLRLRRGK